MPRGLMMDEPLLVSSLIVHADKFHGDTEIVSRTVEGPIHRYTYRDAHRRSRQLAQALVRLGVREGERVGSLAWNGYRHFELYFGVSGMGAVIHTINPRLFPEQLVYIANHAEDRYVFFDLTFTPLVEKLAAQCKGVRGWVAMTDRTHMPQAVIPNLLCYEELIGAESGEYEWPRLDEWSASGLCYTSGTTGNPRGVLYAHRSTILHAYAASLPDVFAASARMTILPVVPMFHVNAWSVPYLAPLNGAKLVFPGAGLDGKSLYELFEAEKVTLTAGVPTVWMGLLAYMRVNNLRFSTLKRAVVGGSAAPPAMIREFDEAYGVQCQHAWGMTEMSPLGTLCTLKGKQLSLPPEQQFELLCKQGRAIYGVDMKIVDGDGKALPHDGKAFGDLMVRGPMDHQRLLQGGGRESAPRRLVPHRRRRDDRRGRVHADHRPLEGRREIGRRVDQLDRPREHRHRAPGDRGSRGHRRAPPEMGRAADRGRGEEAGRRGHSRRAHRALPGQGRQVDDPRRRRLRRRAAAHRDREVVEADAAAADEGLQAAGSLT